MAVRTVRLDDEAEAALLRITEATGLPISQALRRGLRLLEAELTHESNRKPYELYKDLDLGAGGYAIAPSTDTPCGIRKALRNKLHR